MPVRWPISCAASAAATPIGDRCREKVAIQTQRYAPGMAVPELMRILLDDAHLGWDEAWDLTQQTLAYTNHTLLPEALEKWPLEWFEQCCRGIWRSFYEINRRLLEIVRGQFPGDEGRVERVSLMEETPSARSPHGQPGDRRFPQHQRRGCHPFATAAHHDRQRPGGDVPGAFQQQDQRCDAAPLAASVQPGAGRNGSPRPSATAGSRTWANCADWNPWRRMPLPDRFLKAKRRPSPVRPLAQAVDRARSSIRTPFSIARSNASTNTSANC